MFVIHERSIDLKRCEMKSVLKLFYNISQTVMKLELSCDCLHVNNLGGLVCGFLYMQ